jgi:SAM-dependent methyltransferase
MFDESTDLYDLIYLAMKDYAREAEGVAEMIRARRPHASTILDVACGTGEHVRHLRRVGFDVEGVDLNPAFVEVARAKNPGAIIHQGDMVELDLGWRYDAVVCLFSSIGYVRTEARLRRALERLADHVVEGGVVIVEPWFEPTVITDGKVSVRVGEDAGRTVCRMTRTRVEDGVSVLDMEYLIGTPEGIERRSEVHELGLFSADVMRNAFAAAGLSVEYDPEGLMGRGIYIGARGSGT